MVLVSNRLMTSLVLCSAVGLVSGCADRSATRTVAYAALRAPAGVEVVAMQGAQTRAAPAPKALDEDSTLEDCLAYAAVHNPGLEAAFNRWKAALERIPQVEALPDPRFTYRFFIREVETRVGPQQQAIGLSQTFPWLGKLPLRGSMAADAARAQRKRYDAARLRLFYEVKETYHELYYLMQAIDVVRENRDLVRYLEGVATAKYRTASAAQAEVIRAQVELGKLEDQLRALEDFRGPLSARLNAAMNRPVEEPLPVPHAPAEEPVDLDDGQILAWARAASPALEALTHEISREQHGIELARKEAFPDVTFGIDYTDVGSAPRPPAPGFRNPAALRSASRLASGTGDAIDLLALERSFRPGDRQRDSGQDIWMLSLSMNLPIRRARIAAAGREAEARYRAAVGARDEEANALSVEIKQALYEFRDARRKIGLYRENLIPKARQNLEATEAAYRTGAATFLDLVDAEQSLLEFRLAFERARADRAQRLAKLDMLVGRTIPRGPATRSEEAPSSQPD